MPIARSHVVGRVCNLLLLPCRAAIDKLTP